MTKLLVLQSLILNDSLFPVAGSTIKVLVLDESQFVNVFQEIANRAEITLDQYYLDDQNPSPEARAQFPHSDYSACAYDVQQGRQDACLGYTWSTLERTQLTSNLLPLQTEHVTIHTIAQDEIKQGLFDFLNPFKMYTWITIIIIHIVLMLLQIIQEYGNDEMDINNRNGCYQNLSLYNIQGWISILGGSPLFQPKSISGKVIMMTMAMFYFINIALYMASLVNFFSVYSIGGGCNTLDCLLNHDKKIQISSMLRAQFDSFYPEFSQRGLIKTIDDFHDKYELENSPSEFQGEGKQKEELTIGIAALFANDVDAVIDVWSDLISSLIIQYEIDKALLNWGIPHLYCTKLYSNTTYPVFPIQTGIPVKNEQFLKLENILMKMNYDNSLNKFVNKEISLARLSALSKEGSNTCQSERQVIRNPVVMIDNFQGIYAISLLVIVFSVIMSCFYSCCCTKWKSFEFPKFDYIMEDNFKRKSSALIEIMSKSLDSQLKDNTFNSEQVIKPEPDQNLRMNIGYMEFRQKVTENLIQLMDCQPEQILCKEKQSHLLKNKVKTSAKQQVVRALEAQIECNGNNLLVPDVVLINEFKLSDFEAQIFKEKLNFQDTDKAIKEQIIAQN